MQASSNPFMGWQSAFSQYAQSTRGNSYSAPGQFPGSQGYSSLRSGAQSAVSQSPRFYSPLPPGGIYGQAKWNSGTATDVFLKRGSPVYAPFDGFVQQGIRDVPAGPMGIPPGFYLQGPGGLTMRGIHIQPVTQGQVRAGQVIGYVSDDSMDMLGPYQGMPDGFQHADLAFSSNGRFSASGGDIDARQMLRQMGYQGTQIQGRTKGPPDALGMGGGMGMPGMGMGMGGPGGMPGMGMPPMMGGGFGGGQGFGGQGFGMPQGAFGTQSMGGGGFSMPMMPPMMPMMPPQGGMMGGNPFMAQLQPMMQRFGRMPTPNFGRF